MSEASWIPFPDQPPVAYRRLDAKYPNGEIVTGITVNEDGEWCSDDVDNLLPPLGGYWRYAPRPDRR